MDHLPIGNPVIDWVKIETLLIIASSIQMEDVTIVPS